MTIHDVLFESHPEYFRWKNRAALKYFVRRSAHRADAIVTISEFSKREISTRYGINPEKIVITPCGFDSRIFNPGNKQESAETAYRSYGLTEFILAVGRLEPRKNLVNLIKAYSISRQRNKHYPQLVLVGAKDFGTDEVFRCIRTHGVEPDVIHLENVSNRDLAHLYRAASLFVFPSHAEGFGIPLVEAMACGCPVASSGTTAMEEVVKDGCGVRFDPGCPESIRDALDRILQNPDEARSMVEAGARAAQAFSWARGAAVLLRLFNHLAEA